MVFQRFGNQYILRLESGEEVRATLLGFMDRENIRGGYFIAFGAFSRLRWGRLPGQHGTQIVTCSKCVRPVHAQKQGQASRSGANQKQKPEKASCRDGQEVTQSPTSKASALATPGCWQCCFRRIEPVR